MTTYIHECLSGAKIEYRRYPWAPGIVHIQARILRPDGNPFDDRWYPVTDLGILLLQQHSDIVHLLHQE